MYQSRRAGDEAKKRLLPKVGELASLLMTPGSFGYQHSFDFLQNTHTWNLPSLLDSCK